MNGIIEVRGLSTKDVAAPLLSVASVSKSYGSTKVLRDVSFEVPRGACVAFIGENGAGKSTLARCLVGAHKPDAGVIRIGGQEFVFNSPADAKAAGVGFLPQELANVPALTVAENIVLGLWPSRVGITSRRETQAKASEALERLGVDLALGAPMGSQSLSAQQMAEIAKALLQESRLLVLDEPTAALSEEDSEKLFTVVRRLAASGVTLIFISHRMDEVHRFADTVHVMRNGALVASLPPSSATKRELVEHMLGTSTEVENPPVHQRAADAQAVLEVAGLCDDGQTVIRDVGFSVYEGELVGIFGVRGSGNDVIAEILGGKRRATAGTIKVRGRNHGRFRGPRDAGRVGIAYVPQERKRDGLVLGQSIRSNICMTVPQLVSKLGIRQPTAERRLAEHFASGLDIRMRSVNQPVGLLSGGNQQKALLASRLATKPEVLILHEPTRGVDVGARMQLLRELRRRAEAGMAGVIITSDVEEVTTVCDRILIVRDGVIVSELTGAERTQQNALELATKESGS